MTVRQMQDKIVRKKKENGICILAHAYQSQEILEIADFVGDSFALSLDAQKCRENTVIMCGVRFMAETVKILSPEKKVILSSTDATCPMADQMDIDLIGEMQKMYPEFATVAYINTTALLKTVCDVCVTSSSAVKIVKNLPNDNIIFIPDCNLGDWVQKQVPEKNIVLVHGGCPTHLRITVNDVKKEREHHPVAKLLVHPECHPSVTALADFVGSTSAIMDFAEKSTDREFIIGTENSITEHLRFACPDKKFYPLSKDCVCHNMRLTSLPDVYNCINGTAGDEISLSPDTIKRAKKCIDEMLRLGK